MDAVRPRRARRVAAVIVAAVLRVVPAGCGRDTEPAHPYGATQAHIGESLAVLGWNMSVANLRFDVRPRAVRRRRRRGGSRRPARRSPADLRFGLYGALAHPIEANAIGSCAQVRAPTLAVQPAVGRRHPTGSAARSASARSRDQAQVRGVYVYSPQDRIAGTTVAYPAAFPVGLPPTNDNDTGLVLSTTSVDAFRADGAQLDSRPRWATRPRSPARATCCWASRSTRLAARYRDDSAPPRRADDGAGRADAAAARAVPRLRVYGALGAGVARRIAGRRRRCAASLCTQGEINAALLYATVSVVGTHAGSVDRRE